MKASEVEHGFNLTAVRRELDRSEWEEDYDNPGTEMRRVYLGDVFSLTPSGKMYTPFACSNVDACETCRGSGTIQPRRLKRRVEKRHATRQARTQRRILQRYGNRSGLYGRDDLTPHEARALAYIQAQPKLYRWTYFSHGATCTACAGLGSREAHLDELWNEAAEKGIESIPGVYMSWDSGDAFACESREASSEDDSEGSERSEATDGLSLSRYTSGKQEKG